MARASEVRPGQVWTAKVSGKDTKVQVVSELPPKKPGGRVRFQYKNLSTGRMATGTAGKLKRKVSDGGPAQGTPAAAGTAPAAPAPLAHTRSRTAVRPGKAPPGRTMPSQAELELGLPVSAAYPTPLGYAPHVANPLATYEVRDALDRAANRHMAAARGYDGPEGSPGHQRTMGRAEGWREAAEAYAEPGAWEQAVGMGPPPGAAAAPYYAPQANPLPSLRGAPRRRRGRPAPLANPSKYPSAPAKRAAQAIAASGARTPGQVMQAVQAWYMQERQQQAGSYGFAGVPGGSYGPYDNPGDEW